MEQQAIVGLFVERTHFEEDVHMPLQLLAADERLHEAVHDLFFFGCEAERVGGIDRREYFVDELVLFAVDHDCAFFVIDLVEQLAVLQLEAWILIDELRFDLELQNGHSLLDLDVQIEFGRREVGVAFQPECDAWIVAIYIQRKLGERKNVDAIGIFEHREVAVAGAVAHDVGDAAALAERCAHPHDVVIAPLNVKRVEPCKRVHDQMWIRTAVVNVAHQVQVIDGQPLYEHANGLDERFCTPRADNRVDNRRIVCLLVDGEIAFRHELLDDVCVLFR